MGDITVRLSPKQTDKLASVCGLMTSTFDGERATAASMATKMLNAFGLTWRDFCEAAARGLERRGAEFLDRSENLEDLTDRDLLARARRAPAALSDWDRRFVVSLAGVVASGNRLTPKQRVQLIRIAGFAQAAEEMAA